MLKYLLDTNIVIYVIKRRPIEILDTFNQNERKMAVSSITEAQNFITVQKKANIHKKTAALLKISYLV